MFFNFLRVRYYFFVIAICIYNAVHCFPHTFDFIWLYLGLRSNISFDLIPVLFPIRAFFMRILFSFSNFNVFFFPYYQQKYVRSLWSFPEYLSNNFPTSLNIFLYLDRKNSISLYSLLFRF